MIGPLIPGSTSGGGGAPTSNQTIALRVAIIGAVLLALFAVVFFRLWYLQILSGDSLAAEATSNRSRTIAVTAPRGQIVDRNGSAIVKNTRAQVLELAPNSLPKPEREAASAYGSALGKWVNLPKAERKRTPKPQVQALNDPAMVERYAELEIPEQLAALRRRYDRLAAALSMGTSQIQPSEVRRRVIRSIYVTPYANAPLRVGADPDLVAYVAERQDEFPGVTASGRFVRSYPLAGVGAQMLGQVGPVPVDDKTGEVSDSKYRKLVTNKSLKASDKVGLSGLEYEYDSYLRGQDGKTKADIDAFGDVKGQLKEIKPRIGNELQLTLDLNLQKSAQRLLSGSKYNPMGSPGAAVALDPRNGEVLAMVNNPTFDPTDFTRTLSQAAFDRLVDDKFGTPLNNRAITAGYAAASTFKLVTSFASMATGVADPGTVIQDNGKIKVGEAFRQNANATPNGPVQLEKALQVSSDVYFYDMGMRLNPLPNQPLQAWAKNFGYGKRTGIDLPGENTGVVPDRKWRADLAKAELKCRKEEKKPNCFISDMRQWTLGDEVNLAIGQGDVQVTPLQTAVAYSALQNGGKIVRPHLAKAIAGAQGGIQQTFGAKNKGSIDLAGTGGLDAIRAGMRKAASEGGGTSAGVFADWPHAKYPLYGKTGTAQYTGKPDQSWYAAYVDDPKRPIVIVATLERGGYGAETAAPIVGELLKKWFKLPQVKIAAGTSQTT